MLLFIVSGLPCFARNAEPLKVGIDLTYAPYAYSEHQQAKGFDPEFMQLLAQQSHQAVQFYDTRIENLIMGLTSGHYDMIASALYVNEERARQVDFIPYLQTGGVLLVRHDDSFLPQSLNDLCGKRVSMMKGAAWISLMQQVSEHYCQTHHLPPIDIRAYPSAPEASQALLSNGVDVQYEDAAVASTLLHHMGQVVKISNSQLLNPVLIGLAIRKNEPDRAAFLLAHIQQLQQSPAYQALLKHYHLRNPDPALLKHNEPYLLTDAQGQLKLHTAEDTALFDTPYFMAQLRNPDFIRASLLVLLLGTLAWFLAASGGLVLTLAHRSRFSLMHYPTAAYIWLFRSLPLLVLLIYIYNLPRFWPASHFILAKPFYAGLIALVLSESAYMAEIHRAALQGVSSGQFDAGKALGLSTAAIYRKIMLPQALRLALPSLTNQFITIIKLTSLVSVISLTEILLVGQQLYTRNFKVMETLTVVAIYYIAIVSLISWLLKRWEHYLNIHRHQNEPTVIDPSSFPPSPVQPTVTFLPPDQHSSHALELQHLTKYYQQQAIIKNVSLTLNWGEVVSIIGPSGAGKTSLIRTINGLSRLDSGSIRLEGKPFIQGTCPDRHHFRQNILHLGMVFQNYHLFPHKTVLENVLLAPDYHGRTRQESQTLALQLLEQVGMLPHLQQYPHQLSGGQQQRVAIVRALVMQPHIMLFDEPTAALDPELVNEVLQVMQALAAKGMTMLIVTHEIDFAFNVSDRIIFMEHGTIRLNDTPANLIHTPDPRLQQFLQQHLASKGHPPR